MHGTLFPQTPVQATPEGIASELALFIVGIGVGFIAGYVTGQRSLEGVLSNLMAVLVAVVWAFSVYQSTALGAEYVTPLYVHLIMGIVAGSLFAIDSETAKSIATVLGRRASGRPRRNNDRDRDKDRK